MNNYCGTDSRDDRIFCDLSADNEDVAPMEVESLCVNCHRNGVTRILCTRIPFYRQIIVMSFSCGHCGYSNNELQSGEAAQEHGIEIVLHVENLLDWNRQVIKSEYAEVEIKELELTIPPKSQSGEITTVEGILRRVITGLSQDQNRRRQCDPESAGKIDEFIKRAQRLVDLQEKFTLKIKDVSGNSFIQNPVPFHVDPHCVVTHFNRSFADKKLLGFVADDADEEDSTPFQSYDDAKNEVLRFATDCPNCGAPTETCMKPTDIPYFTTVILMCTTCDTCGWKSNEIKSGGAIRDHGCRLTVSIEEEIDLARDVLKSDTCSMFIPELDLEVGSGALSGRFTTVEGLLIATRDQLKEQRDFFLVGDSRSETENDRMKSFLDNFEQILRLRKKVRLVLDDPTGNSYIQSLNVPMDDNRLKKEFYERTNEQNDELGLNDMKTENYSQLETINECE
ncbi:Zpr1-PA [Loa loa]|uniref:Zpr1-PA n=1 Tax=Loa loa TaxID=7209 RepID=A0A1I7VQT2_LOALO|nr:Zpr1-PA [Loa loa]EFO18780.1 Zpr1-PA [Loa loa]